MNYISCILFRQASDINGCSDGTETKSINSSTKGVISLTNAKSQSGDSSDKTSSSKGSKIISLKKSPASDSLNTENKEKVTNEVVCMLLVNHLYVIVLLE